MIKKIILFVLVQENIFLFHLKYMLLNVLTLVILNLCQPIDRCH
jgi:hypothetical protein